jgi:hypothetical protein
MQNEVQSMGDRERACLDEVLRLAQKIAAQLESLDSNAGATEALCLRLAQAHAFGLVDQLAEIARAQGAPPRSTSE